MSALVICPPHIRQNFQIFSACILGEKAGSFDDDSETFREIYVPADLLSEHMDGSCGWREETADALISTVFPEPLFPTMP